MTAETPRQRRRRLALAAFLGTMTVLHVTQRRAFQKMIPGWLPGRPSGWNAAATVAEGTSAVLLTRPGTARAGGWAATATIATVYIANVEAARTGGTPGVPPPFDGAVAAWLRLPLQAPLLYWAWQVARPVD